MGEQTSFALVHRDRKPADLTRAVGATLASPAPLASLSASLPDVESGTALDTSKGPSRGRHGERQIVARSLYPAQRAAWLRGAR